MRKTIFCLFMALCLLLCACGKAPVEEPSPSPSPSATPSPTPTPTPSPSPTPTPTPEPTPEPTPAFVNPLTGVETEEDVSTVRPYAIMLNNLQKALPQCGVSQADIIFEMIVEGGITRMVALFQDVSEIGAIGSIRSARPYYLDVVRAFDAIYIHAGGSDQAYMDMRSQGITHIDGVNGRQGTGIFYRDAARRASAGMEHSLFTTGEKMMSILPGLDIRHEHEEGFKNNMIFAENVALTGGEDASGKITVEFSAGGKGTGFTYDAETKTYLISEFGSPYVDGNTKAQVSAKNVLILQAAYSRISGDTAGRLRANLSGGEGYFACNGKLVEIDWTRDGDQFVYTLKNGDPVTFNVGNTYVCVINQSNGQVTLGLV